MKIYNNRNNNLNFQSARINVVVSSDNHGNLTTLPEFYKAIQKNKEDIFQKADEKSTLNLFVNAGDFFINPSKKGFLTHPEADNGDIQKIFLKELIRQVQGILPEKSRFHALYTPGNHCFDGGDDTLLNLIDIPKMTTVLTNVKKYNFDKNVVKSLRYSIPDDKDPNYKHHVLVLGTTIPSMKFYNPGLLKNIEFVDDMGKKDSQLEKKDLEKTFNLLRNEIKAFKTEHPQGVVLLNSHMGTRISKMIRDEVKGINEIFDAHQHDCSTTSKGNTHITSLGKDNEIVKSVALTLEKNGEVERETNTYFAQGYPINELDKNKIKDLLDKMFEKDVLPALSVVDEKGELESLDFEPDIRYANSYLANYLTSALKQTIKKTDPDIDIVGLPSSIIRGGFKNNSNNLKIMKIFDGVSEDLSTVKVGKVSGKNLLGLIAENVESNIKYKTRNTIIHWSDIQINRTLVKKILSGIEREKSLNDAIKIRTKSGFEKINPSSEYKIAIVEKYLMKNDIKYPSLIKENFVSLNKTYDELFREHLKDKNYQIKITKKTKENRII